MCGKISFHKNSLSDFPPFGGPGGPMGGPPMGMGGPPMGGMPPPQTPDDAWQEFSAPDGRKYYYNTITQENVWEKPQAFADREGGHLNC